MAIVLVIDLPTWLVATAGACALAVLVWQGRAQAARRDSEGAPDAIDEGAPDAVDEWYVVAEGAPDAVDEAAPVVGEGTPDNVAEAAPVAAPALIADTTPVLY